MNRITRLLAVLLTLVMVLPLAMACAETPDPSVTTAPENSNATTNAPPANETTAEETVFAQSNIPEDLKFPGTTIRFLHWDDTDHAEFFVEDADSNFVNNAIFTRNERVQEQFDITLDFTGTPGNFQNLTAFVNTCVNSTQSGADAHDIFAGYSMSGATLMTNGVAQDMKQYSIMEFDKPWWPNSLIEKATIKDGVYFASGDISTTYLYMMYSIFFNKDMFANLIGESSMLYDLVYDGEWTLDKMIEFATGVFSDQNGDNQPGQGDRFGFSTTNVHFDSFYTGADLSTVITNDDGLVELSEDLFSQKTIDLLAKVCAFLYDSGDSLITSAPYISKEEFADNNLLFISTRVRIAEMNLANATFSYGILPAPKYDKEQENYRTCMSFPYTMYLLSTASPNSDAAAATLELMAYQSYLLITPALFEQSMKLRYSDESDDSFMYDIIRENVVIDVGRLFSTQLGNMSYNIFRSAVAGNSPGAYASLKASQERSFQRSIDRINQSIEKLK